MILPGRGPTTTAAQLLTVPRRETLAVAGASIAITAVIAIAMAYQRAGIASPFEVPVFRHLILYQDYYAIAPFIAVLLAALLAPVQTLGEQVARWCGRFPWAVALMATAACAVGAQAVYHAHPLSMDEYAVLFQSKLFAEGRLTGQFPPLLLDWLVPPWMQGRFLRMSAETGAVLSGYWPGFSLLLTPFTALGVPWLLNPLIGGATVLVMHRLALALFGTIEAAGYVVLFTLASPAVTVNAISYYAMPAHLLANGVFMLLLLRPSPIRALLAGLVGSLALVLHNPVPHLLFALPWIAWLSLRADRWRILAALAAGYLPVSFVLGWGWAIFIETVGGRSTLSQLATPAGAAGTLMNRIVSIVGWTSETGSGGQVLSLYKLWLWAMPGLVAMAALGAWRRRKEYSPWIVMAASALLTYFAYFLVRFDQGHGWGFRYFHSAWLVLPLLAVAAFQDRPRSGLPTYLAACALLSLALLTTLRALQVEHFIASHLAQVPVAASGEPHVIIMDQKRGYYAWDLAQNDPLLREPVIRLISRNPDLDRRMMSKLFPDYRLLAENRTGEVWGLPAR